MMDLQMSALARQVTLTVNLRGVRRFRWRLKVARWLIRLAACVVGCGIEVEG